ncbi:MAG: sigma-54-dependent Fis family transcriptional regulator [Bacteroidales bacterium]|nr:sigma-54-dependent Fis family transcriptional regulator [Bacteroidales bacterium]
MDTQELQRIKNRYDIIGNDAALNLAIEMASVVAPSDLAVLITGENGSGKDVIPRIIHDGSRRRTAPFLAVNCGAIPVGTINAELFGHEKGSFTGAVATRKGYFEEADGGTLFLDEIGELPRETQAMLLRVLQDGEYLKVGSSKVEKANVRIIAATNINLLHAVETGKFREDLYYRLNAFQINMPSLRDRKDDIYLLFRKFTLDFSERSRLCKISLTHDAISVLKNYRWPGNVRQLKNFTEALTVMESKPITPGADRVELDAPVLLAHMPREAEQVLPAVAAEAPGGSRMSDDDMRAIVKAILDLKQEVDRLKKIVETQPAVAAPAVAASAEDEAEWQESQPDEPAGPAVKSIRQSNDELYAATLAKYDGKVKLAAAELGVSERTIYRWLAQQKKK